MSEGRQLAATCLSFEIIFQNEEMVVVNKPPDVAMDGDHWGPEHLTVQRWVHRDLSEFLAKPLPAHIRSKHWNEKASLPTLEKKLKFVHQLEFGDYRTTPHVKTLDRRFRRRKGC